MLTMLGWRHWSTGQRLWFVFLALAPYLLLALSVLALYGQITWGIELPWRNLIGASTYVFMAQLCVLMFHCREYNRAFYGAIEVSFALMYIYYTLFEVFLKDSVKSTAQQEPSMVYHYALIGGCVYIFVRGMDNLNQGLKRYPKLYRRWQWICLMKVEKEPTPLRYPWQNVETVKSES